MSDETERARLLRLRAKMKRKRPKFKRENYYRLKRIQTSWRRPKGIDSKMRHKLRGKRKSPGTGYRGPRAVRGLHPSGKEVVQIHNVDDLDKVDPEYQIAQIGKSVGSRKRLLVINEAEELGIHIINPQIRRLEDFDDEYELEEEFELLDDIEELDELDEEELDLLEDDEVDDDDLDEDDEYELEDDDQ